MGVPLVAIGAISVTALMLIQASAVNGKFFNKMKFYELQYGMLCKRS